MKPGFSYLSLLCIVISCIYCRIFALVMSGLIFLVPCKICRLSGKLCVVEEIYWYVNKAEKASFNSNIIIIQYIFVAP